MNAMTEAEAREKWCPMARVGVYAGNREVPDPFSQHPITCCIASKCMAWRWVRPEGLTPQGYKTDPDRGYCGAFGRPE